MFFKFRYDSEDDIDSVEPLPPPVERKERNRDKSMRKKPIDARDEPENADYYSSSYDKTYDQGGKSTKSIKRKVKTKETTSPIVEVIPPEELPLPLDEDNKEERSAEKSNKKLKKDGKKKRKHKKSPDSTVPVDEVKKVKPGVEMETGTDNDENMYDERHETRVSPEPTIKSRKSDTIMKSVVIERPRSPTPEEHLTTRKRTHSQERDGEVTRKEEMRRAENTRDSHVREGKQSRHVDNRNDETKTKKRRSSSDSHPPPPPPPPYVQNGSNDTSFPTSNAPRNAFVPSSSFVDASVPSRATFAKHSPEDNSIASTGSNIKPTSGNTTPTNSPGNAQTNNSVVPNSDDTLMELLRRHPVMWQGLLGLKNDSAAIQMHYVSGNSKLAEFSLPKASGATGPNGVTLPPILRIAQRMRMEVSQLEGVTKRMQVMIWLMRVH